MWMQQQESCLLTSDGNVGRRRKVATSEVYENQHHSVLGSCDTGTNGSGKNWQLATFIINICDDGIYRNASVKG